MCISGELNAKESDSEITTHHVVEGKEGRKEEETEGEYQVALLGTLKSCLFSSCTLVTSRGKSFQRLTSNFHQRTQEKFATGNLVQPISCEINSFLTSFRLSTTGIKILLSSYADNHTRILRK